jgi:hypothetical protein
LKPVKNREKQAIKNIFPEATVNYLTRLRAIKLLFFLCLNGTQLEL